MLGIQSQIKFFDYRRFIERFSPDFGSINDLLDLTHIEALNEEFFSALQGALIEWASNLNCSDVVFWNASNCYLNNSFYPFDKSGNTISLQELKKISLKNIPNSALGHFCSEKFIYDLLNVKNFLDLSFPAFVLNVDGKAVLVVMVKSRLVGAPLASTTDLLKDAEDYLCKQVRQLNSLVQIQETKLSLCGELTFFLKEQFLTVEEWKNFDSKTVGVLIDEVRLSFKDLHQAAVFKKWKFDFLFCKNRIDDFKIFFNSKDVGFLSLLLQFFSCFFSVKLNQLATQFVKISEKNAVVRSNLNLKIQFNDGDASLLNFSDTFASRFRMIAFYSSVKSAIIHDGSSILALGGFYLSSWYLNAELKQFWFFSSFLDQLESAVKHKKNPVFVFSPDAKPLPLESCVEVSSDGIFIRKMGVIVSLNVYISILLNSIAERLSLLVDGLSNELKQTNKKLTYELLGSLLDNQKVEDFQSECYFDLKKLPVQRMSVLLSGSSLFHRLLSENQKELLQDFVTQKYSDSYRQVLLCKIQEIESFLQTLECKNSLNSNLEQLLENLKSFYIETKDLHSEAMMFAFGRVGRDLLIRIQQIMIERK